MSLSLEKIKILQKGFDRNHSVGDKAFYVDINESNIHELEHLIVCLLGELGEFANILKKVTRGDFSLEDVKGDLDEELVDAFIYLIKISNQFNVDLEEGYLSKLEKNKQRFNGI
ncbi:nucleotide pyrophosphohydrolase [Psychrobacter frigidicola]|uniref:Nucleotide pyrophosphohydrolase n=1 Tax=Psychrobacter frigidicola TaxID=45611 RepID=A0A5C7A0P7_9GAMM|nr:MazG nucleotide pyrophosphohydrolase domain-containing protein [Psychrobacter frigidicola]TXD96729.1 nucleotide pyrophosphohydrolase [Psychrobacter frigidicola]